MNITIIGLGLIGGSLAKTIKKRTNHTVMGMDTNPDVLSAALQSGAIDRIGTEDDLGWAALTILCIYPKETVRFLTEHAPAFRSGSIVTDTAGVKTYIFEGVKEVEGAFTFLGGHPMAGKEVGGFANATDTLFDNASYILTPAGAPAEAVAVMEAFIKELGFGRTVITTPENHDSMIAYTSQIAHVLACAYVLSPRSREHAGYSAGSFRDVSRVAKINEELWAQLFLDNSAMLSGEIDTLIGHLEQMRSAIATGDRDTLKAMLRKGREIKEELEE